MERGQGSTGLGAGRRDSPAPRLMAAEPARLGPTEQAVQKLARQLGGMARIVQDLASNRLLSLRRGKAMINFP